MIEGNLKCNKFSIIKICCIKYGFFVKFALILETIFWMVMKKLVLVLGPSCKDREFSRDKANTNKAPNIQR